MENWPDWYCPVCGEADGDNADKCCDCNDYLMSKGMGRGLARC